MLKLADHLSLPLDLITQKTAILARTGAGKTNAAVVIAEGVLDAKQQIVVLDPKGDWWGLRSSADGKTAGYPVTVLGGEHGDVPLEPTAGAIVADLIVDQPVSVVLDVSEFSNAQRGRFVAAFADRLYRRKSLRPDPVLLILEEADEVCPQRVFGDQAEMVGAIERIVKRGRFKGIGTLMITQRSASLNKDILTQTEVLIVMQTTGPQDIKAIDAWIEHHPDQAKRAQLLAEVGALKQGEAFLWSPSWLERFTRFRFRMRHTFDAGRTPKVGERRIAPKVLADVDLAALREKMAATIERAKADDPKELRRKIADLERQLATRPAAEPQRVEVPVLSEKEHDTLKGVMGSLDRLSHLIADDLNATFHQVEALIRNAFIPALARAGGQQPPAKSPANRPAGAGPSSHGTTRPISVASAERLQPAKQRILDMLAWCESIGLAPTTKVQLALLVEQSPTSGGYFNYLGALRSEGLINYPGPNLVGLTELGRERAAVNETIRSAQDLHESLYRRLPPAKAKILRELIARYPKAIEKGRLAEAVGQSPTSGGFFNYLGSLRSLGVIDYPAPGQVVALPVLFLER